MWKFLGGFISSLVALAGLSIITYTGWNWLIVPGFPSVAVPLAWVQCIVLALTMGLPLVPMLITLGTRIQTNGYSDGIVLASSIVAWVIITPIIVLSHLIFNVLLF